MKGDSVLMGEKTRESKDNTKWWKERLKGLRFLSVFFMLFMIFSFFSGGLENRNRLMHGDICAYIQYCNLSNQIYFKAHWGILLKWNLFGEYILDYNFLKILNIFIFKKNLLMSKLYSIAYIFKLHLFSRWFRTTIAI